MSYYWLKNYVSMTSPIVDLRLGEARVWPAMEAANREFFEASAFGNHNTILCHPGPQVATQSSVYV